MPWLSARGRLEAVVVIADLPADAVAGLLPPGLELRDQTLAPPGRHPLILVLGEHSRVGPGWLPFGLRYRELVVALPWLQPRGGPPGPFCHLPLLLLDRQLPTLLGRWLYGFAKRRARLEATAASFEAGRRSDRRPLLSARFLPTAAGADLRPVRALFAQPLINQGSRGRWRYARFDFGFERARLRAVEAEVMVDLALLPGLPAGPIRARSAFRLATAWTLGRLRPGDLSGCGGARPGPRTGRS